MHCLQQCNYPGKNAKLHFDAHYFESPFYFYLMVNFECFLVSNNDDTLF